MLGLQRLTGVSGRRLQEFSAGRVATCNTGSLNIAWEGSDFAFRCTLGSLGVLVLRGVL